MSDDELEWFVDLSKEELQEFNDNVAWQEEQNEMLDAHLHCLQIEMAQQHRTAVASTQCCVLS